MNTKKIKIKDLKPGMKIKTYENGDIVFKPVLDSWKTIVEPNRQRKLYLKNKSEFICSSNHPIMVLKDGQLLQIMPDDLTEKDNIVTDNGLTTIERIEPINISPNFYDITVDTTETFFSSINEHDNMTLSHNCSQGGVRGGAATLFYPFWHLEFENLVVLKNNRGTEETRVRHLDYGVQMNGFLWNRVRSNGKISLFSPSDVPGLYEAFFADQDEFKRLYEEAEQNPLVRRKEISALDLMTMFAQERAQTGRIYVQNVDHCNQYGKFIPELAPIKQSNLCLEITLPTEPVGTPNEEIALCTLAAFNLGEINSLEELAELADIGVRALDALLDYQDYPVAAAEKAKLRRSLGFGVTNFAYYLAKNGKKYSDGSANNLTHELSEAIQYYLLKASNQLAKEFGQCGLYHETKYAEGILPVDLYKKDIDGVHTAKLLCDWKTLRKNIAKYGLRNSTLTAQMPCESSSQVTNSTNGIEPPRGLVSVKSSKDGVMKQVVNDVNTLTYETLWEIPNNKGYLELVGIMQKFFDQSISANTNYDPARFPDGKVPAMQIIKDLAYAYKMGVKTLYYHNTRDGADDNMEDDGCESGACKL